MASLLFKGMQGEIMIKLRERLIDQWGRFKIWCYWSFIDGVLFAPICPDNPACLDQSTGQVDKDGVELFGGDICVLESSKKYEVKSMLGILYNHETGACELLADNTHRVKKIGNKYENPELLESK